jgi:hypothetical protein
MSDRKRRDFIIRIGRGAAALSVAMLVLALTGSGSVAQTASNERSAEALRLEFERDKWRLESEMRKRELAIKEREQTNKDVELQLKREEQASSKWWNPLVVAILAAALAALGNAIVTVINGRLQRELEASKRDAELVLEDSKAESTRILEMIRTGDTETAAKNLAFLLDAGLVIEKGRANYLREYLANRQPGTGPSLPSPTPVVEPPQPNTAPALYRWPVRTGSDLDASLVNAEPIPATIEELAAQSRPRALSPATGSFPAYQNRRTEGAERTVYVVEATIVGCQWMHSQMIHLNLEGDSGQTIIANCPHPDPPFVKPSSRWVEQISQARLAIQERLKPVPDKRMCINERARITGIGFFNQVRRQWGMAPNGLELSPVLSVEWLS